MIAEDTEAPAFRTRRLCMRPLRRDDAPEIAWYANDLDVARMTTGLPHPYGLSQARAFIDRAMCLNPDYEALFVLDLGGEEAVGLLGFHPNSEDECEVGFWIGRPYWGRGLMTEALAGALAWASQSWGRRWIVSGHFADNAASARVLVKAGFLHTGEIRWRVSMARDAAAPTRMMVWLP